MLIVNQFSFVIMAVVVIGLVSLLSSRFVGTKHVLLISGFIFVALVMFHFQFKTNGTKYATVESFEQVLGSGEPVAVVMYSDFCVACLSLKPDVDRLESNIEKTFVVIRLNVMSDLGSHVREKYDTGLVPSFLFFDRKGNEVWRHNGGVPEVAEVVDLDL